MEGTLEPGAKAIHDYQGPDIKVNCLHLLDLLLRPSLLNLNLG